MQALGMFAWFGYRLQFKQRLEFIAKAGFAATCLWFGEEEELVAENRADRMPALLPTLLVTIERGCYDSMDDATLVRTCIEPTIQLIRGRESDVKSDVYRTLTPGQRALMMFWVLYGHARSAASAILLAAAHRQTVRGA